MTKTIDATFEDIQVEDKKQKPSKLQWFPVLGTGKLVLDHFKGKPTIPDFYRDAKGMKKYLGEVNAIYQGVAASFVYEAVKYLF